MAGPPPPPPPVDTLPPLDLALSVPVGALLEGAIVNPFGVVRSSLDQGDRGTSSDFNEGMLPFKELLNIAKYPDGPKSAIARGPTCES